MSRAAARWAFPLPAVVLPCFPWIWEWCGCCGLWAVLLCRTLGVLSLGCDTVSGCPCSWSRRSRLSPGGAGLCPGPTWLGRTPKFGERAGKGSFPGHFWDEIGCVVFMPRDDVSAVVTGQSLLLLQCWAALGHGCHLPGTQRWQGCGGSRGLPGMQGKAGPWLFGGASG